MNDYEFMRLRESTKDILIGSLPDEVGVDKARLERCIEDVVKLLQTYHGDGMPPYEYSSVLLELAVNGMAKLTPLPEAQNFARKTRDHGELVRKIIAEDWPPPDH